MLLTQSVNLPVHVCNLDQDMVEAHCYVVTTSCKVVQVAILINDGAHSLYCLLMQVPLEVMTASFLRPKHGVFVQFEPRRSHGD